MINNVILVGRLTKDIEIRQTTSGSKTTSFALAVNRTSKKEGQPDADFINCVAWNKTAELMAQYLRKGSLIGIEGRIQTRSYDNQQGQKVYVTEVLVNMIQFLGSRNANLEQNGNNQPNTSPYQQTKNMAPKNEPESRFNPQQQPYQPQRQNFSQAKMNYGTGNVDVDPYTIDSQSDDLPF